jgi:sec-independent protein translocase protein TatA
MTFLMIGTTELLLISGVALLLFGGKKLPEMMRGLGQGVKEFKKGMKDEPEGKEEEEHPRGDEQDNKLSNPNIGEDDNSTEDKSLS